MSPKQRRRSFKANVLSCILMYAFFISIASCAEGDPCWKKVYESEKSCQLYSIWGSSSSAIYAVGHIWDILFFNGTNWSELGQSLHFPLSDVWGLSSDSVYVVAHKVLHYDGYSWGNVEGLPERNYHAIWGSEEDDMYLVGSNNVDDYGVIHHYDGVTWSEVKTTEYPLYRVWGSSFRDIYVSGSEGKLYHYDGKKWEEVELPADVEKISCICGRSEDDIYLGGEKVLHYNGYLWEEVKIAGEGTLSGGVINGYPSGRVAAAGSGSRVFLLDGLEAKEIGDMRRGEKMHIYDIWVSEEGLVYAAGSRDKGEYEVRAVIYRYNCNLE